jgi:hypothetical protein
MKSFIVACVAAIVIAYGAALVLEQVQASAEHAFNETGTTI